VVEPDVARAKIAAIARHLDRVHEVRARPGLLPVDVEELTILNVLNAVQAGLDLAAHVAASEGYGTPATQAECFTLLQRHGVIDEPLAGNLRRMAGFRNLVVHRYAELDTAAVESIVEERLDDLRDLAARVADAFDL